MVMAQPEDMINIWLGVSKSLFEMLLNNIHDINLNKFKQQKADILAKIERLVKSIEAVKADNGDMYT